jgi:hypothetical protein
MPLQCVEDLCVRVQEREQVCVAHRGQVYLEGLGQCAHVFVDEEGDEEGRVVDVEASVSIFMT